MDSSRLEQFLTLVRKRLSFDWEFEIRDHLFMLNRETVLAEIAAHSSARHRTSENHEHVLFQTQLKQLLQLEEETQRKYQRILASRERWKKRAEMFETALRTAVAVARSAFAFWDNDDDVKVGKILSAFSGQKTYLMPQTDLIHAALALPSPVEEQEHESLKALNA